jgi:hypothetical protein
VIKKFSALQARGLGIVAADERTKLSAVYMAAMDCYSYVHLPLAEDVPLQVLLDSTGLLSHAQHEGSSTRQHVVPCTATARQQADCVV